MRTIRRRTVWVIAQVVALLLIASSCEAPWPLPWSGSGTGGVVDGFAQDGAAVPFSGRMAVAPDGALLVVDGSESAPGLRVARFGTDGVLDAAFGNEGVASVAIASVRSARITSLASGEIVVAGSNGTDVVVARFLSDGQLDTAFGPGGLTTLDGGGVEDAVGAVKVHTDGKVVVLASQGGQTGVLFRLQPNGAPDTSFGEGGRVVDAGGGTDLEIQPDGKLLVSAVGVARYHVDGTRDTTFSVTLPASATAQEIQLEPLGPSLTNELLLWAAGPVADGTSRVAISRVRIRPVSHPPVEVETGWGDLGAALVDERSVLDLALRPSPVLAGWPEAFTSTPVISVGTIPGRLVALNTSGRSEDPSWVDVRPEGVHWLGLARTPSGDVAASGRSATGEHAFVVLRGTLDERHASTVVPLGSSEREDRLSLRDGIAMWPNPDHVTAVRQPDGSFAAVPYATPYSAGMEAMTDLDDGQLAMCEEWSDREPTGDFVERATVRIDRLDGAWNPGWRLQRGARWDGAEWIDQVRFQAWTGTGWGPATVEDGVVGDLGTTLVVPFQCADPDILRMAGRRLLFVAAPYPEGGWRQVEVWERTGDRWDLISASLSDDPSMAWQSVAFTGDRLLVDGKIFRVDGAGLIEEAVDPLPPEILDTGGCDGEVPQSIGGLTAASVLPDWPGCIGGEGLIAIWRFDGTAWRVSTTTQVLHTAGGGDLSRAAVSPDGERVLAVGYWGTHLLRREGSRWIEVAELLRGPAFAGAISGGDFLTTEYDQDEGSTTVRYHYEQARPNGSIAGHVDGGHGSGPLAGIEVSVAGERGGTRLVTTDANGRFVVNGLPPGLYRVTFHDPSGVRTDATWGTIADPDRADWVGVDSGIRMEVGTTVLPGS